MKRSISLLLWLAGLALVLPVPARAADADDCTDTGSECSEDCLIQFGGSVRVEMKKKYDKCIKKCAKKANLCHERVMETKNNALEEGALDKSPGSDEVDENNMPTRTTATGGKKDDARRQTKDDLRDDQPTPEPRAEPEPKKTSKPKAELREDEVPRSTRTQLKSEPEVKAKDEPQPKEEPKPRDEPRAKELTTRDDPKAKSRDEPKATKTRDEPKPVPSRAEGPKARDDDSLRADSRPAKKSDDSIVKSEVKPPPSDRARPLDEDLRDDRPSPTTSRDPKRDDPPKKREDAQKKPAPKPDDDDLKNF